MKNIFWVILFVLIADISLSQNTTCANADPFCTGTNYNFPASTNAGSAQAGPNYGCLWTQPNPAWYYLEIDNPGNITMSIQGLGTAGGTCDIDFICWGPFTNPATMCNQLTAANIEDCSYSPTWNETCQINGASNGDYYVLLITNYSNQSCNINFSQTGGNGTTNCCIIGGDAGDDNNISLCDTDPAFNMINQLLGNPDLGGIWYNSSNTIVPSVFDPSIHMSGVYSYIVPGSSTSCPDDTAYLTITINPSPNVTLPIFADVCNNDSVILLNTGSPNGGNYTINNSSVTNLDPASLNIGNNIIAYNYTDMNGCSGSASQNINVHLAPFATATTTNASCNGYTNGTASLNITAGTMPYVEDWGIYNPTSLAAGTYAYTITDANSCVFSDSVIIYEPGPLTTTLSITNVSCNGQSNGTAVVSVQGNSMPNGTVSTLNYCNSTPGSSLSSTIDEVQLTGDIFSINNNTAGSCDQYEDYTTLYADVTEGQSYNINILLGDCSSNNYPSGGKVYIDWNIDGDFTDPGEEVGIIPYGISSSISIPVSIPFSGVHGATRMRVVSQFLNNIPISMIGPCDVGVMANPIYTQPWFGATEDYSIVVKPASINATYLWSSGQTTDSISNLSAGLYSVDVTDQNGCTNSNFFSITQPSPITAIETQNNISCDGGLDGGFSLNISGGITDYTVNTTGLSQTLSGGVTIFSTPNNLSAGTYNYTITDSNNCIYTNNVTLTSPNPISVSEIINNVSCNGGNDGNVLLVTSGGTLPHTYLYNNGWNPSSLSVGTYSYTITDDNGCLFQDSIQILEPAEITLTSIQNNVTTCGASDGNIDVSVSGGTQPYVYNWNNGSISEDINNLTAGIYTITVTDNNLCTETLSVTIIEPIAPIINYSQINTNCHGSSDGSIDITINGGLGPYQYGWSNAASTEDINNLPAGIYSVSVTDANNCVVTETITITEPSIIGVTSNQNNVTTCNGNDGSIDITPTGGTGSYMYLWNNNATTEDINGLVSGPYSVNVTDINNCSEIFNFTIHEPNGINASEIITNVSCFGDNNGSVTLNINGGQGPYIEDWNGYNPLALTAGIYTYTITDNINCFFTDTVTITEPQVLGVTTIINNVLCTNDNNGNVILNMSGGTSPYNEDWGTFNPNSLSAGIYNYIVTDANGCTFSDQVTITEPSLLSSNISTMPASCYGYNDGTAIISTSGGTSPYNTDWFGQNNMSLNAGNYNVLVTDDHGCTNSLFFTIQEPAEISFLIDSFATSCFGYSNGKVVLTISGGAPPYVEDWNGQDPLALAAGIHTFTITDSNNCIKQGIATIYEPNQITTNQITSDVSCHGGNNGTAFLQISGGTAPYTENWNGVNVLQLSEGTYMYTITDNNNCTFTDYVIINEPEIIEVSEDVINANCFNSNDGQAIITINGGTPPYNENWGVHNPFALGAGIYNYIVTDQNGCTYTDSVVINQSNEVSMSFSLESPICIYDSSEISISVMNPISSYYTIEIYDGYNTSYILIDSLGNDFTNNHAISFTPTNSSLLTIVSITDENGCTSPVNQGDSIIVNPLPILSLDIPDFCKQDTSRILDQGLPTGGEYFINNIPNNLLDIENLEISTYNIRYEYINSMTGCFNSISTEIYINENPTADFEFGPQPINIDDPVVEFINRSTNYHYVDWVLSDGSIITGQDIFTYTFDEIGEHTAKLYIENIEGCADSVSYIITIDPVFSLYIPSAFSPNDDHQNETFGPSLRENGYLSYSMQIFNQWGEVLFDEKDLSWDGTFNGQDCQSGTYSYIITAYDFLNKPYVRTGSFILIR